LTRIEAFEAFEAPVFIALRVFAFVPAPLMRTNCGAAAFSTPRLEFAVGAHSTPARHNLHKTS